MRFGPIARVRRYGGPDHARASSGTSKARVEQSTFHRLYAFAASVVAIVAVLGATEPRPAHAEETACGGAVLCEVPGGRYAIELPKTGPVRGVYVFFHGYQSSAEGQMRHRELVEAAHRHGLAFAAPNGEFGTWAHPNAPSQHRDEIAFTGAVLDDLGTRFGFVRDRVVVGGFSQGASMAWYAVCSLGDRFAAAVTFSGVFWDPLPKPEDCRAVPPPMIHFHGRADRTFPLAGRAIGSSWQQGDTFESIAVERARGQCRPDPVPETVGGVACETTGCERGDLALCLHDGGHSVEADQLDAALTRLGF